MYAIKQPLRHTVERALDVFLAYSNYVIINAIYFITEMTHMLEVLIIHYLDYII